MNDGSGDHFEQAGNAQVGVETDSRLIVAARVSDAPNDKEQLVPTVPAVPVGVVEAVGVVLADNGFYSAQAVQTLERDKAPTVYARVEKTRHHRTVADLEQKSDPVAVPPEADGTQRMRRVGSASSGPSRSAV